MATGAPESSVQSAVFQIEMGRGKKVIQWVLLCLLAATVSLIYTARDQFRSGLNKREAIDMAQLARNIARGEGYTTHVIRPLSLWQLEQHGWDIQDKDTRDRLISHHIRTSPTPFLSICVGAIVQILPQEHVPSTTTSTTFFQPSAGLFCLFDRMPAGRHIC